MSLRVFLLLNELSCVSVNENTSVVDLYVPLENECSMWTTAWSSKLGVTGLPFDKKLECFVTYYFMFILQNDLALSCPASSERLLLRSSVTSVNGCEVHEVVCVRFPWVCVYMCMSVR